MSVKDRLDDARLLYANGRKDGALLSVLVAVGATSRKRYPKGTKTDSQAFTTFLGEELVVATHGGVENYFVKAPDADKNKYPDEMMPLQNVFYELVRCNLAHEAKVPSNVRFEKGEAGAQSTSIQDEVFVVSDSWIDGLAKVVEHAPENLELFPHVAQVPEDVLSWILFGQRRDRKQSYMISRAERVKLLAKKIDSNN